MVLRMNPSKLFPLILTDKLDETKAFYTKTAGWSVTHEMPGYLQVRSEADEASPELAFMDPAKAPALGSPMPKFQGEGLVVSVPTASADDKHKSLLAAKAAVLSEPSDKPWGWRSFTVRDPNGLVLDFFHEVEQSSAQNAAG